MGKYTRYLSAKKSHTQREEIVTHDLDRCAFCLRAFLPQVFDRKVEESFNRLYESPNRQKSSPQPLDSKERKEAENRLRVRLDGSKTMLLETKDRAA